MGGWDCSWIGRFGKEEDERLFFGGYYRIKVVNLRLIETNENMKQFVSAIFYLDALLTAAWLSNIKKNKNDFFIIEALMNQSLNKQTNVTLPSFICDCFHAFTQNKKQIIFDLENLNDNGDKRINDLVFHSLDQGRYYYKESKRKDKNNLIRLELLPLFPNIKTLIIQSTNHDGHNCFSFSLMGLLNVISQSNVNQIFIKSIEYVDHERITRIAIGNESRRGSRGYVDRERRYNWIKEAWEWNEKRLKKDYAAKGFQIEMKKEEKEYQIEINK